MFTYQTSPHTYIHTHESEYAVIEVSLIRVTAASAAATVVGSLRIMKLFGFAAFGYRIVPVLRALCIIKPSNVFHAN